MTVTSSHFFGMPHTKPGYWSAGLAIVFVVLLILNVIATILLANNPSPTQPISVPNFGFPTILCGLAAGMVGLIAVTRRRERSWLVWLSLLSGVFSLTLLIGDFLAATLMR